MHRIVVTPFPVLPQFAVKYGLFSLTSRIDAADLSETFTIVDRDTIIR